MRTQNVYFVTPKFPEVAEHIFVTTTNVLCLTHAAFTEKILNVNTCETTHEKYVEEYRVFQNQTQLYQIYIDIYKTKIK